MWGEVIVFQWLEVGATNTHPRMLNQWTWSKKNIGTIPLDFLKTLCTSYHLSICNCVALYLANEQCWAVMHYLVENYRNVITSVNDKYRKGSSF